MSLSDRETPISTAAFKHIAWEPPHMLVLGRWGTDYCLESRRWNNIKIRLGLLRSEGEKTKQKPQNKTLNQEAISLLFCETTNGQRTKHFSLSVSLSATLYSYVKFASITVNDCQKGKQIYRITWNIRRHANAHPTKNNSYNVSLHSMFLYHASYRSMLCSWSKRCPTREMNYVTRMSDYSRMK